MFEDFDVEQEFSFDHAPKLAVEAGFGFSNSRLTMVRVSRIRRISRKASLRLKRSKCRRCSKLFVSATCAVHNKKYCSVLCKRREANKRNKPRYDSCLCCGRPQPGSLRKLCGRQCRRDWVEQKKREAKMRERTA